MAEHIRAVGSECEISADLHNGPQIRTNAGFGQSSVKHPKHKLCYLPGVIREIEIWRVAVLMVNRYADEAEANSFMRAEELRPKREFRRSAPKLAAEGDHAGAAIWRRITVAIEQLTDTTGTPN
jgi:hypothetical protein